MRSGPSNDYEDGRADGRAEELADILQFLEGRGEPFLSRVITALRAVPPKHRKPNV